MIPYFVALIILGIPLGWVEWTIGRYGGARGYHSAAFALAAYSGKRALRYLGAVGILVPMVVGMYYIVIEAWCLQYALAYLTGTFDLGPDPRQHLNASANFFTSLTSADVDR